MDAISIVGHSPTPTRPHGDQTAVRQNEAAAVAAQQTEATEPNVHKIASAVQALNLFHEDKEHTRFQYRVNPEYGTVQVTLFNYMTGEIVSEIPSRKVLDFAQRMREISGMLLEKQA